jgi:hypothetical protein
LPVAYTEGGVEDPYTAGLVALDEHAAHLLELAGVLENDTAERARLVEEYDEYGADSTLGAVIGGGGPMGELARLLGVEVSRDVPHQLIASLRQASEYTSAVVNVYEEGIQQGLALDELPAAGRALLTGDLSGLDSSESAAVIEQMSRMRLISPEQTHSLFRDHTTIGRVLDFASSTNAIQTGVALIPTAAAALASYSLARELNAKVDRLVSIGKGAGDNPLVLPAFREGAEEAVQLAVRFERTLLNMGEKALMSRLRALKPVFNGKSFKSWEGRLNEDLGVLGETAVDLVFGAISSEDGTGLFREITDRFKYGSNKGIDRTLVTNSGKYIDLEVKASGGSRWPEFNSDQKKGAAFFVRDRLEKIASTPGHPAREEAKARVRAIDMGFKPQGYAIVTRNAFARPSSIETQIRLWDRTVSLSRGNGI